MGNKRQYVAVKFHPNQTHTYTYYWDGEPFAAGDEVRVPDRSGDGWKRVTVHEISWAKPPFVTKAVLGRFVADDKPRDLLTPLDIDEDTQSLIDRDRF